MRGYRAVKILKIVGLMVLAAGLFGLAVEWLWNGLIPSIFGLRAITFMQALGLLVLSKILFGGLHRHGRGRPGWRRHMQERWAGMSPEERERFQAGMRGRRACGFGPAKETVAEQTPV